MHGVKIVAVSLSITSFYTTVLKGRKKENLVTLDLDLPLTFLLCLYQGVKSSPEISNICPMRFFWTKLSHIKSPIVNKFIYCKFRSEKVLYGVQSASLSLTALYVNFCRFYENKPHQCNKYLSHGRKPKLILISPLKLLSPQILSPLKLIPLPLGAPRWLSQVKNLPAIQETWVRSLGQEDPLEQEMATHSSPLAWRIPWTEEPGGLQSTGSQRVRHD